MKKYMVLLIIIFLSVFFCGCVKKEPELSDLEEIIKRGYIIVGVKEDSPPFGYYKNGVLTGIDIEIAKNIANDIFETNSKDNIKFVKVNPQNRISKLNSKEVDVLVATMSINEKRKLVINFSNPYFVASQKLMVRSDSKITTVNYFNKTGRLGVIAGTTGEKIVHLAAPKAKITSLKSYKEAVTLLQYGQIDGIMGDDCILKSYLTDKLRIINKAYTREFYAVAVRKSDKSVSLLNEINQSIAEMFDEKKIKSLGNK